MGSADVGPRVDLDEQDQPRDRVLSREHDGVLFERIAKVACRFKRDAKDE